MRPAGVKAPPKHQPLTIAIVGFAYVRSSRQCQHRRVAPHTPLHVRRRRVDLAEVLLQVHAGRERVAGSREHEHAAVVVGVERLEHVDHLGVELRAHRVALLGPVQLDPGDAVLDCTRTVSYLSA